MLSSEAGGAEQQLPLLFLARLCSIDFGCTRLKKLPYKLELFQ
jgi:hypothetical protein